MKKDIKHYYEVLTGAMRTIVTTDDKGNGFSAEEGIEKAARLIYERGKSGGKLLFIGNGASAAIASHQAVDFWKNTRIPALSFNDGALLTCMGNDYGYEHVFEKPLELFMEPGDVLFAVSSSGESENIIRAVDVAKKKKAAVIGLSGFKESNRLRKMGDLNFYVSAKEYGYVEVTHLSICHCLLDIMVKHRLIKG